MPSLPSIPHDFHHAVIENVVVGPRREITFAISPLVKRCPDDILAPSIQVRFGGIENFDEVRMFFESECDGLYEVAWLRYAAEPRSKPGALFVEILSERSDSRLIVRCSSLQVSEPTGI